MKKFILMLVILLALPTLSFAYNWSPGDTVAISDGTYGNFLLYDVNDQSRQEETFCVQKYTYFNWNQPYYVEDVSDSILGFGVNDYGLNYVTDQTKWLFGSFALGQLPGYTGTQQQIAWLQNAIWAYQGYNVDVTNNPYYALAQDPNIVPFDVAAVNIYSFDKRAAQSQLTLDEAGGQDVPVPEPATMVLFGSGLILLGLWRKIKE